MIIVSINFLSHTVLLLLTVHVVNITRFAHQVLLCCALYGVSLCVPYSWTACCYFTLWRWIASCRPTWTSGPGTDLQQQDESELRNLRPHTSEISNMQCALHVWSILLEHNWHAHQHCAICDLFYYFVVTLEKYCVSPSLLTVCE